MLVSFMAKSESIVARRPTLPTAPDPVVVEYGHHIVIIFAAFSTFATPASNELL